MTADPLAYPEMLDPAGSLELRSVKALERIATALEQMALAQIPADPKGVLQRIAEAPRMAPEATAVRGDIPPWESAPIGLPAPVAGIYQAPVQQPQQFQPMAVWQCPVHHASKIVPAGVSKSSGKPYNAFMSCTERECNHVADRCRVQGCPDGPR
jgi:hypothetical protein